MSTSAPAGRPTVSVRFSAAEIAARIDVIAAELAANLPADTLVVSVGGGGLISGNAIAINALRPDIAVIGVEVESYPSFHNALTGDTMPIGGATLAEGIAVKYVGAKTLPIVRDLVADHVIVLESAVERAVDAFATHQRSMAEGAGAAGLAALLHKPEMFKGKLSEPVTVTVSVEGVYGVKCTPHYGMGMVALIVRDMTLNVSSAVGFITQ